MGKLEKVVVLTVLFLVAVILGVSLNSDKGVAEASGPISARREARTPEKAEQPERELLASRNAGTEKKTASGPAGVLSAGVEVREPTPEPEPVATEELPEQPDATFIQTLAGLEPSLSEEMMIYTWKHGDTFTSLADLYYGSRLHVGRLRSANDARRETELVAGDRILVPVLPPLVSEIADAGEEITWKGGSTYTVQSGDVLGAISQTVYGTSKNWRKIFDANRDQLADANTLTVGTVLRIPQ